MKYLTGEQVQLTSEEIKKIIGKPISYLPKRDIDTTGRGWFFPRYGVISEIKGKQIGFENGAWESLSKIKEIVLIEPQTPQP